MRTLVFLIILLNACSVAGQLKPVSSGIYRWNDLPVTKDKFREGRKITEGSTYEFEYFEVHATTQLAGAAPKPYHTQSDLEELIIIKEGTLSCSIGNETKDLPAGSVLLIPPGVSQQFENKTTNPVTYYVFMFRARKQRTTGSPDNYQLMLHVDSLEYKTTARGGTKKYFDRPTAMTENYEMHVTWLSKQGASHNPHTHIDTEVILMISGNTTMEIDGRSYNAGPGDLYIIESGKLHGISNTGNERCSYFAFKWR